LSLLDRLSSERYSHFWAGYVGKVELAFAFAFAFEIEVAFEIELAFAFAFEVAFEVVITLAVDVVTVRSEQPAERNSWRLSADG
jgi:hypothetical protein